MTVTLDPWNNQNRWEMESADAPEYWWSIFQLGILFVLRASCVGGIMSIFLFLQQNNSSLALLTEVRNRFYYTELLLASQFSENALSQNPNARKGG